MLQLIVIKPERCNGWLAKRGEAAFSNTGIFRYVLLLLLFCLPVMVMAQPVISSFTPATGSTGTTVKISGSGFSGTTSDNIVYFGAVKATVASALSGELTVTVPSGASYAPLSVTIGGLTAKSNAFFTPTFATCISILSTGSSTAAFEQNTLLSNATGTSIGGIDMDGDGKPDVVAFNNFGVNIFRNNSAGSAVAFASKYGLTLPTGTTTHQHYGEVVADLDGDGKLDIAVVNNTAGRVLIYRNQSTSGNIAFSTATVYTGFSGPTGVAAGDFDGDGKPDLAVLNSGSNTVSFLKNNSTTGAIAFNSEGTPVSTGSSPNAILAVDFDNDGKTDIAVTNTGSNSVSVFRNTLSGGTLSFGAGLQYATGTGPQGIGAGDFNRDGKTDLVVVNGGGNTISIFNNTSSTGNISFTGTTFTPSGSETVYGKVAVGDLDGDSKPDIVAGSNGSAFTCFKNETTGTGGAITFNNTPVSVNTGFTGSQPAGVCIADFNEDGQPDLANVNSSSTAAYVYLNALSKVTITGISQDTGIPGSEVVLTGNNLACVKYLEVGGEHTPITSASDYTIKFNVGQGYTGNIVLFTDGGSVVGPKFTFVTAPSGLSYKGSSDTTVVYGTSDFTRKPELSDGGGGITYQITDGAVSGITINKLGGQINWSDALAVGVYTLQVTATNSAGSVSTYITIRVIPDAPKDFSYLSTPYTAYFGTAGHSEVPDINWMGQTWTAPKTPFRIISPSDLPASIAIDPNTGVVTWADNTPVNTYHIVIRAENDGGTTDAAIDLEVKALAPTDFTYTTPNPLTIKYGTASSVPVASINWHGKTGSFSTTATLPSTITLDPVTGLITSGNNAPVGVYSIDVTADNGISPAASANFTLTIEAERPSDLTYAPQTLTGYYGDAGVSNAPTVNWHGKTGSFEIIEGVAGVTMADASSGVINWSGSLAVGTYTIKIKARNNIDYSDEFVLTLIIKPKQPSGLLYTNQVVDYGIAGTAAPESGFEWNGETGDFHIVQITPANTGITINTATGVITYKDTISGGVYDVKVEAINSAGAITADFWLTVNAKAPTNFYYDPAIATTTYGKAGTGTAPKITWNGETGSFAAVSLVPSVSGFAVNSKSGVVSWNATPAAGTYTLTVRAKNSLGTSTATFKIVVEASAPTDLTYASHPASTGFGGTGNSGIPSVSWHGEIGSFVNTNSTLPAGLTFDEHTGVISWDASLNTGTYTVSVKAVNSKGESNLFDYQLVVSPLGPINFSYPDGGETRLFGQAGTSRQPSITWSGETGKFKIDPAAYTAGLPTSITIDENTGEVSWPANLPVNKYAFNVIASNSVGVTTTLFTLTVTAGAASGLKYNPAGTTITYGDIGSTAAPAIIWYGETGTFSVKAPDPIPDGIAIDDGTGVISWDGTVAIGAHKLTVWATNTIGGVTDEFTLTVIAGAPTDLAYSKTSEKEVAGTASHSVKPTVNWHGDKGHFEIVNQAALPSGITIDADGYIQWSDEVSVGTYSVQVKAINSIGASNIVTVTIQLTAGKPTILYDPSFKDIEYGQPATSVIPTINWHGEVGAIGIANASDLPAGITIDADGTLHFPTTLPFGTDISVYVTVSNSQGQNSATYKVKVGKAPSSLVYTTVKYSVVEGTAGKSVIPSVEWNGLKGSYKLTNAPTGVTIEALPDAADKGGQISWSNKVAAGVYTMVAYAENTIGKSNEVTIELEVYGMPSASITGEATICEGVSQDLTIALTGKSPWSVTYTDGTTSYTIDNITASPYILKVSPTATTTYTLTSVEDANAVNNTLDAATAAATVTVSKGATAFINNGDPISTCNEASLVLTASGAGTGGSYLWSNGATTESITVTADGNYSVKVTDVKGCTATSDAAKVTLNTVPKTAITTPATTLICEGSSITLTASGATTYQWYRNGIVIAGATAANYKATQDGNYTVDGFKTAACSKTATQVIALTFAQKPNASFTMDSYCKDQPVQFTNTSTGSDADVIYTWHFGDGSESSDKNPKHTYTKSETVMVILEAASKSCPDLKVQSDATTVAIETAKEPVSYEPINGLKNRTVTINGRSFGIKYSWSPVDGLSNATSNTPSIAPVKEETYKLKITTKAGCITVDTQLVRIFSKAEIFVPKGFTPNGDGVNDLLFPIAVGINELQYFRIYNRWGVLMYETKQAGTSSAAGGWDGKYNGALQPMDSYTWVAEGIDVDGKAVKISGNTVLLR